MVSISGPLPRNPRFHSLDICRGIACLLVVFTHSTYYSAYAMGGNKSFDHYDLGSWIVVFAARSWVGVPIFFVISGYCLTAVADSSRRKGLSLTSFLTRRYMRILPPYLFSLILVCTLGVVVTHSTRPDLLTAYPQSLPDPLTLTPWQWFGNLTLTEIFLPNLVDTSRQLLNNVAWTLCYEEQFYLVIGLMVTLFPRRLFASLAIITIVVIALTINQGFFPLPIAGFFFDGHWIAFALGILVYWRLNYAIGVSRWFAPGFFLLVFIICFLNQGFIPHPDISPIRSATWAACFALALILIHPWDKQIAHGRVLSPIAWSGAMCYSLYLVHNPICKLVSHILFDLGVRSDAGVAFITLPCCVLLAVLVAWPFHRFIEVKFMASSSLVAPVRSAEKQMMTPMEATHDTKPLGVLSESRNGGHADYRVDPVVE